MNLKCMNDAVDRLIEGFRPSHYKLFLHPNREQMTFNGTVEIVGKQLRPSTVIKLHAKGLRIEEASFSIGGGIHSFTNHKHGDHDVLYLAAPLEIEGDMTINLTFFGEITEPMVGLYICNFEHGGKQKQLLSTQFEAHHAREVFPCIDEPAAKAVFDVTLRTLKGESVLFNTPEQQHIDEGNGWISTTFETTPIMSTYLVAFVTGELESVSATTRSGTITRVWTTPGNSKYVTFALDVAVRSLELLEKFFETPFPLSKIDHVGLPDFAAGAMENWGLITYRESGLLIDDAATSLENKQWSAVVIAHELSHQWFGNLVTMEWWTDLWLNEGFASWMERFIPDQIFPEWNLWEQFVTDDYFTAQSLDSLASSHPIEAAIDNPEDIRSIFDEISYDKGASVIRMLYDYLGDTAFRDGLRAYIQAHQYANATTSDLWSALEKASNKPVREFMSAWTAQTGFPLVSATISESQVQMQQQRYLINPVVREATQLPTIWPIPISATNTDQYFTLSEATAIWEIPKADTIKLNRSQSGFYIVQYDEAHVVRLAKSIREEALEPLDRLGVLHDTFQLAKAGYGPTIAALTLLDAFDNESDAGVWKVISGQIGSIRRVFGSDELREHMKPFLIDLVKRELARLGWEKKSTDSHFDRLLRPIILGIASVAEEPSVLDEAHKRYVRMKTPENIDPDVREVVLTTVARHGETVDFETLLSFYNSARLPQVKLSFASALCSFTQPELTNRALDIIISNNVRLQDVAYWVSSLFANRHAKEATWSWLKNNWEWVVSKFGTDIMTFSAFPKIAGRSFATENMLSDYENFFNQSETTGIEKPISQGYESMQWRVLWHNRDRDLVWDYFKNWKPLT